MTRLNSYKQLHNAYKLQVSVVFGL